MRKIIQMDANGSVVLCSDGTMWRYKMKFLDDPDMMKFEEWWEKVVDIPQDEPKEGDE